MVFCCELAVFRREPVAFRRESAVLCPAPVARRCEPTVFCPEPVAFRREPLALRFEAVWVFCAEPVAVFCFEPVAAFCFEPVAFCAGPVVFCPEPDLRSDLVAFRVFDGAAISVLLPAAAAAGRLAFPAVSGEFPELLPGRF